MLQNKFERPLDLVVNESKILNIYLYLIFVLSLISIFISSLSLSVQLLLCIVLFVFSVFTFKKQNLNKIISLRLSRDDKWEIEVNNKNIDAELYGECIVTYFIIWLNFTTCNKFGKVKTYHILLLPDSSDKDLLRRLRVRLRFLKSEVDEVSSSKLVHRDNL